MNKLNVFNTYYCPWKYPSNWSRNIRVFFRQFKWAYQRITRGYCDFDYWDLDHYLEELLHQSLKSLADNGISYPGTAEFPTYEKWQEYLYELSNLFEKSQEEYTEGDYKNAYEDLPVSSIDLKTGNWKARTPEEEENWKNWYAEEKRIAALRSDTRNKALAKLTHVWNMLWD